MNLVECAINDGDDYWIENVSVFWKGERMKAFYEASTAVAESAKEEEVGEFADECIRNAEEVCEEKRFCIGSVAVMAGEDPNNCNEKDWENNTPISFDYTHACTSSLLIV